MEKSLNFGPSLKRLLGHLVPERVVIIFSIVLAVAGIVLSVIGPKILGWATDVIFTGFIGKQLPAGATKEQAVAALRAQGDNTFADLVQRLDVTPGVGIDFSLLSEILLVALGLYVVSSLLLWWQGYLLNAAVQRSIYRMRNEVQGKINRLPLSYFDRSPRGELLSRVTNDIDNISQALQQTLSQLLTSLLTVVGVVIMMFVVSPMLALIALVTIPISVLVTGVIGKRAQKQFVAQWRTTGELNGHIEEAFTGQSLVKVFGRRAEVEEVFRQRNEGLYSSSFAAQFISGMIMPTMMFIGNLNYVIIAVVGGLRVASGTMNLGDVQAFIQYTRMFTQPLTQVASMANLLQSGVASAERVFEVLDAPEHEPDADRRPEPGARPGRLRPRGVLVHAGQAVDHRPEPARAAGPDGGDRRPHRGREDHPGQPDHAVLRAEQRPDPAGRRRHLGGPPGRAAQPGRHGAAGHLAVPRHHPRQHRVRPAGRLRGGDPAPRRRRPTWTASCTRCPTATRR